MLHKIWFFITDIQPQQIIHSPQNPTLPNPKQITHKLISTNTITLHTTAPTVPKFSPKLAPNPFKSQKIKKSPIIKNCQKKSPPKKMQNKSPEQLYKVEKIIGKRQSAKRRGKFQYLVKWEGWDVCDSTWEPEKHLEYVLELVENYERDQRLPASDESSFFAENKPSKKKISKKTATRQPTNPTSKPPLADPNPSQTNPNLQPQPHISHSPHIPQPSHSPQKKQPNQSTLPSNTSEPLSLGLSLSEPDNKYRLKVLGMRKGDNEEFWYYVRWVDGTQCWVCRDEVIGTSPISLIQFYEGKIVFAN